MMDPTHAMLGTGAILIASLVGSAHCAGMCGPLALAACAESTPRRCATTKCSGSNACTSAGASAFACSTPRLGGVQWRYHAARLISYAMVGAAAGALGTVADIAGSLSHIQHLSALLAGATLCCVGIALLMRWLGIALPSLPMPRFAGTPIRGVHARALRLPTSTRAFALGLVTPLLPCGWLWAFVAFAAGTGHPLSGAIVLMAFWCGTVPALAIVLGGANAASARLATSRWSHWLRPTIALLLIAVGAETAVHRAQLAARVLPDVVTDAAAPGAHSQRADDPASALESIAETAPACCRSTP